MQIHTDTHVHNSRDWRTVERNSNREGFRIVSSRKQTKSVFTNRKKPSWVAAAAQQQRQQTQQRPRRRLVSVHSLLSLSLCVVATHCRSAVAALFAAPSASFFKCCSFCSSLSSFAQFWSVYILRLNYRWFSFSLLWFSSCFCCFCCCYCGLFVFKLILVFSFPFAFQLENVCVCVM